jgi:hypothetical protein
MKNLKIVLLFSFIPFIAFYSFKPVNQQKTEIECIWIFDSYENGHYVYKKAEQFDPKKQGIAFKENGELIKRQNAGWCGTPPISYSNFEGKWKWTAEDTILIEYKYWGGVANAKLKVVSLDDQTFKFLWLNLEKE